MPRIALLVSLLALAALAFAPAPLPKAKRGRAPAGPTMDGLWRRQSGELLRIEGRAWWNRPQRGNPPTFEVASNPLASPAAFDLTLGGAKEPYLFGIYKVDGDRLTICYNSSRQRRPTAFEGPGQSGGSTEVFTRAE